MLPEIQLEELHGALDGVAAEMLEEAAVQGPPVNTVQLAHRLGLSIAWDDRQRGRARLVHLAGGAGEDLPSILLRHDPRHERQQWAIAHEIGEASAHRVFSLLRVDPREAPRQAREQIANGLASRLLLPPEWFAADGTAFGWDLLELKQRYATASHELIARRMLDFAPQIILAVYDQDHLTWRKCNLPSRLPKLSPIEISCRRRAHESGQIIHEVGPPSIRVWPIHEPQWKREISRLEIDEFAAE